MSRPRLLDLPHGHQTLIDEEDWPRIKHLTLYLGKNGYVYFSTWKGDRSLPSTLHSFLLNTPSGMYVDHINGDRTDNRRSVNLRVVDAHTNGVNRHVLNKNNKTGFRGVNYAPSLSPKKPWRAQITVHRKNIHLGLFATREEALAARKSAEADYYEETCP